MKTKQKSPLALFWRGAVGELRLHASDFWQMPLIPLVVSVLLGVYLSVVLCLVEDTSAPEMVAVSLSVIPVIITVLAGGIFVGVQFGVYYKLGVQMGQTRRAMLARTGLLALVEHLYLLGTALLFSGAITLFYSRFFAPSENLLAFIPWWGWVFMVTLPVAGGSFVGVVPLRFGRKGFWVLYAIFMTVLFLPQLAPNLLGNGMLQVFEQVIELVPVHPIPFCVASVLPFLGTVAILWRLPLRD